MRPREAAPSVIATTLTNAATAVVGAPASDPDTANNTASVDTDPAAPDDTIFENGFDPPA